MAIEEEPARPYGPGLSNQPLIIDDLRDAASLLSCTFAICVLRSCMPMRFGSTIGFSAST